MIGRLLRVLKITRVALRYGLDEIILSSVKAPAPLRLLSGLLFWRDISAPRGVRLRRALEELGPIFVKFGQVLSTRRDLMPPDLADELALLQDRVPPFPSELAIAEITRSLGQHPDQLFATFSREPVASASVAQVHFATLKDGTEVAVKVLRPGVRRAIGGDVALMHIIAGWVHRWSADGRRLRPREVVAEFDKYLHDELDLMREAANASQLRRNFDGYGRRGFCNRFSDCGNRLGHYSNRLGDCDNRLGGYSHRCLGRSERSGDFGFGLGIRFGESFFTRFIIASAVFAILAILLITVATVAVAAATAAATARLLFATLDGNALGRQDLLCAFLGHCGQR
mgnify:CR=1 FL=1